MTELKLYNTLSRSLEPFKPLEKNEVRLYCCGPTVYNFAHIGNLRTYVFEDLLVRTLTFFDLKVKHVMNITDVGHLASDADEGDDKMILAMKREGKTSADIADFYTEAFFKDCQALNIKKPTVICKATEHINEMIELIKTLIEKDFAYESQGNVYFDVQKNEDYGKLAGLSLDSLLSGARIDVDGAKRSPHDFALWFTKSKFENQELQWDSPWGRGYPGWHIECSAMSMKYLGQTFDIHCGGIDHIPVHHTNEIAQSECATGQKFSNFWLHGGFLVETNQQKMSKSKGEFLTLEKIKTEGFDPLSYRYLCLTAHYSGELSWSWDALKGAQNAYKRLIEKLTLLYGEETHDKASQDLIPFVNEFKKRIGNDLNTPQALAFLHETLSEKSLSKACKLKLIEEFDQILGLDLLRKSKEAYQKESESLKAIPSAITELVKARQKARGEKKFELADSLRKQIEELGYSLKDTPEGPEVKRR